MGDHVHVLDQRLGLRAEGCGGNAEEDGEHDDLQDFILAHGIDDAGRERVMQEVLQRHRRLFHPAGRIDVGQWQMEADAGLQQVDHDQAKQQRHQRHADEPAESLGADAADGRAIAHAGNPDHQRREDQRRDDHLDQAQEDIGQQRDVAGELGDEAAFATMLVDDVAADDAEHQGKQNVLC